MRIDLSRPDVMFGVTWLAAVAAIDFLPSGLTVPPNPAVKTMILANAASFVLIQWIVSRFVRYAYKPRGSLTAFMNSPVEQRIFAKYLRRLLLIWLPLYLASIVYSGGLPVIWMITGSGKRYTDFGVPTVTGCLNMIRAFIFAGGILLYLATRRRQHLRLPLILLALSVVEISRGAILVMLLHGAAIYLFWRRFSFRSMITIGALSLAFIVGFDALGTLRGGQIHSEDLVESGSAVSRVPTRFFYAYTYLVSSLNNLYYAADRIVPTNYPYYSLQTLVPTVVREAVFAPPVIVDSRYGFPLYNAAFNQTSVYGPLVIDFGLAGAAIVMIFLQFVTCYVYARARNGSLYFFLAYPALFMAVVLSVFYMYFLSMVVAFYPVLAVAFNRFRRARLNAGTRLAGSPAIAETS